jgi:hypothetical protein
MAQSHLERGRGWGQAVKNRPKRIKSMLVQLLLSIAIRRGKFPPPEYASHFLC